MKFKFHISYTMNHLLKSKFLLLLVISCSIFACKPAQTPQEKLIHAYCITLHNDADLELLEAKPTDPITAADSLAVLRPIFESARDTALMHLDSAQVSSKKAYEIAKEGYETTGFPSLKPMFRETMEESEGQMAVIGKKIAALKGDCEGTQLEDAFKKVEHYKALGDQVLLYPYQCRLKSSTDELAETVYLDPQQQAVRGHLKKE